ncbi:hypothetical protein AGMMS49950_07620 [Endomicrobiia bacterium]|nr:hypothetical protein AGMMS49556_07340 [Endomicrobiia bacterium]GHT71282.1 hypothetical protein AGMMS49950_07620 [Endomicrobiia bacterium]
MARFVKGTPKPKNSGWKSESKKKRKKIHEIFDDAFYKADGIQKLDKWISASDDNYGAFLKIMAKRIPQAVEVSGSQDNRTPINIMVPASVLKV